jgi:hypothetical protein
MDPTIGRDAVLPIKQALTESMGQAADQAGVGPQWREVDASWPENANTQRVLSPYGGQLDKEGPTADTSEWLHQPTSEHIRDELNHAIAGRQSDITKLNQALPPSVVNSALAEALAAKGRPQSGSSTDAFRADKWGERVRDEVMNPFRKYIADQGGSQALTDIEDSAAAGRTAGGPSREAGGTSKSVGAVLAGAKMAGSTLLSPLLAGIEDPGFVRALAGRSLTDKTLPPLLQQYGIRAGLGAQPSPDDVRKRVAGWVSALPSTAGSAMSGIANVLSSYAGGAR